MTRLKSTCIAVSSAVLLCACLSAAEDLPRTKVAQGEYRVAMEGDLGCGPIETEIFHFREAWVLWKTSEGYDLEGERTFDSPRDQPHDDHFIAKLSRDLRPLSIKVFTQLIFRSDSGPLSCEFLPQQLRCDSGAKDPAQRLNVQFALDRPYSLIWPLSAFSLAALTQPATEIGKPVPIQVVQLEQISSALPILAIRSDGLIRYVGQSEIPLGSSEQSWHAKVYELTTAPVGKLTLWTSPQGLLLAAERSSWPKARMELLSFKKFAEF